MCKSFVLYVLVWWSVPCFVFVVVAAQNPLLIFVSYLSISYVLQQRPFFMLDLFSPVDEIRFRVLFSFWLCDCVCVSILRNFMSLFSHFVGDYLSISATIRRILNSEDNKWRILFCCSFTWIPVQYFTFKWNDTFSDCDWSISNQR